MGRKVVSKPSFLGGEAGALLEGRSDLAQFQLGCSRLQNFITLKSGAATRRPPSRYAKNTANNNPARLIEFTFNYDNGDDMFILEVAQAAADGQIDMTMIRVSDNSIFTVDTSVFNTPWLAPDIDLDQLQFVQSADTLFLVHKGTKIVRVIRDSSDPTFSANIFWNGVGREYETVPYRDSNISLVTLTPSVTTATGTLTSSSAFFNAGHVGAYFKLTIAAVTGYVRIDSFTSTTVVGITVLQTLGGASATTNWRESSWSDYRGWPRSITFYNSRLVFGGNTSQPDTIWASSAFNYFQLTKTHASTYEIESGVSDALNFTLNSKRLNQINWMEGGKKLTIGTSSSEWVGQFREDGTNLFIEFDEETSYGSGGYIQARKSGQVIPFVQRNRKTIREMVFDFNSDSFVSTDLNLFASHIGSAYGRFESSSEVKIKQMVFQEGPFNILWVIDSVGRLYGLTRDRQQQIASWHSHVIGGKMTELLLSERAGEDYPSFVTSICCAPSPDGANDRLWMVVRRDIDGVEKYFVEYLDDIKSNPNLSIGSAGNIRPFLDCSSLATAASTVTWNGYTRFANEEVYVIAEAASGGMVHSGLLTVSGAGVITLPTEATTIVVGLHADAEIRLLPMEGGNPEISMLSSKRADLCAIRMHETFGLRIGKNRTQAKDGNEENTTFEPIPFNATSLPILPTFTGTKEVTVPTDNDTDGSFALVMKEPWPCTILSLSTRVVSNEV